MFAVDEVTQAPRIGEKKVKKILRNAWGIVSCNVEVLNGYEDMNFRISQCVWESDMPDETVIFKITNPVAAKNTRHLDFQRRVCETLCAAGIPAPYYIPLKKSEKIWRPEKITDDATLPVRLIRVLPGTNLEHFEYDQPTVMRVGRLVGEFHNVMDTIPKAEWEGHIPFIAAENVECAEKEVEVLVHEGRLTVERAAMVQKVFEELKCSLLIKSEGMDTGLIHSDINDTNILVKPSEEGLQITGLIDMGDVHCSLRIMDIGATCLYLLLGDKSANPDWARFPRWVLSGYETVRECRDAEKVVSAMRARMACSLICGLRAARINYRNEYDAYVLKTQVKGWRTLEMLMRAGPTPLL